MDRRRFIGAIGCALFVTPLEAAVDPAAKVYRIGWLELGGDSGLEPLRRGLGELGWIEGRNIAIEPRFADNRPERLAVLASELVRLKVDVIVTQSTPAALAAKNATVLIPIVMAGSSYPVERGLVSNLAHPGENITGLTHNPGPGFHQKLLQLLKEVTPRISRVAVLWSTGEESVLAEARAAAPALGLTIFDASAREPRQVPAALAAAVQARTNGLLVTPSPLNTSQRQIIADFAAANQLPSVYGDPSFVRAGGLMSYWTNWDEVQRRSATYVDKILKGAKAGDLPIEQPTKFELVINLKTAKALKIAIPQSLLLRADEVVQ